MSESLCSVAPKIWLALPTSAVPFMLPRVSVNVPETPIPSPDTLRLLRTVVAPRLTEVYPRFAAEVFGVPQKD